jgi:hypothetical protein
MPERNILRVSSREDYSYFRYRANIHGETGRLFEITGSESIEGVVKAILNADGEVLRVINQKLQFKTERETHLNDYSKERSIYWISLPDELTKDYEIRENEFIDVTFERIVRGQRSEPIFPKMLRYGLTVIKPIGAMSKKVVLPTVLVSATFDDPFYANLVLELNEAFGYGFYRSTLVLLRVLFENLLVDLLRSKFGMTRLEFFYDKVHQRHQSLSVLLDNLEGNLVEFRPLSDKFDKDLLVKIDKYKQRSDASAHILEEQIPTDFFEDNKDDIDYVCRLLQSVLQKIKSPSLNSE